VSAEDWRLVRAAVEADLLVADASNDALQVGDYERALDALERLEKEEHELREDRALVARVLTSRVEKAEAEVAEVRVELQRQQRLRVSEAGKYAGDVSALREERDALRAFETNVRELLARAGKGGGKRPTHYCAHCLASFDGPEATNEHARTCPQSPVAKENAALRAEVERLRAAVEQEKLAAARINLQTGRLITQARREERAHVAGMLEAEAAKAEAAAALASGSTVRLLRREAEGLRIRAAAIRALGDKPAVPKPHGIGAPWVEHDWSEPDAEGWRLCSVCPAKGREVASVVLSDTEGDS
jgi:hypothetical protein